MQPVLTQVPPNKLRSMIATFIPGPANLPARDGPDCSVPMMIASYSCLDIGSPFLRVEIGLSIIQLMPASRPSSPRIAAAGA